MRLIDKILRRIEMKGESSKLSHSERDSNNNIILSLVVLEYPAKVMVLLYWTQDVSELNIYHSHSQFYQLTFQLNKCRWGDDLTCALGLGVSVE